jgi:hypothetical protein
MADITGMDGVALGAMLNNHHCNNGNYGGYGFGNNDWRIEQNQANMSLMQSIGQVDKAVAVSTADMQASQATQSAGIVAQLNSITGALATRIDAVKDVINGNTLHLAEKMCAVDKSIMENRYELSKDITHDGDKTRNILTTQYQDSLNRLLSEARNEISDLRNDYNGFRRSHDNTLSVTQTVNQAQAQSQNNAHFDRLYHMLHGVGQNIRDTNTAINFGAGTLTNTNTPTNTNNNVGGHF